MRILRASDSSVIAVFGDEPSLDANHRVLHLFHGLCALNEPRVRNIHPAYASVLVDFDPRHMAHDEISALLERLAVAGNERTEDATRSVLVPVCYDPRLGPDLEGVAGRCGMPVAEVVRLHSSVDYFVSFLGFSPGFGYLAGLPDQLAVPRLATPRKLVHAGSVGIAGRQTGVYPINSPGGWNIIGRTPLRIFNPDAAPPALLQHGDTVRFVPIDFGEFEERLGRCE